MSDRLSFARPALRRPWPARVLPLAVAAICAATAFARASAEAVSGYWLTEKRTAVVELSPCDERLCGRIVWMAEPFDESGDLKRDRRNDEAALRDRPWCGMQVIDGLTRDEDGRWTGEFYYPKHGRSYQVILRPEGERLKLRAYLGVPVLGRSETWQRAAPDQRGCPAPR